MSRAVHAADFSIPALATALIRLSAGTPCPPRRPFDEALDAESRWQRESAAPTPTDLVFAAQNQAFHTAQMMAQADLSNALIAARASHRIALAAQAIAAARAAQACSNRVLRLDVLA